MRLMRDSMAFSRLISLLAKVALFSQVVAAAVSLRIFLQCLAEGSGLLLKGILGVDPGDFGGGPVGGVGLKEAECIGVEGLQVGEACGELCDGGTFLSLAGDQVREVGSESGHEYVPLGGVGRDIGFEP